MKTEKRSERNDNIYVWAENSSNLSFVTLRFAVGYFFFCFESPQITHVTQIFNQGWEGRILCKIHYVYCKEK